MRIFTNAVEMYDETFRELFKRGQTVFDKTVQGKIVSEKDFEQNELVSYSYMLTNFDALDEMMLTANKTFQKEHLTPRVSQVWFDDMIENNSLKESWWAETEYTKDYFTKFCDEGDGNAAYSYGERTISKLKPVIERLKANNYSRGSFINIYETKDVFRVGRRTPCTIGYHFLARDTIDGIKLNVIVSQRSCDAINFFPHDLYKAYLLLKYIAKEVNLKVGYLVHNINSLHAYKKDIPEHYTW